VVVLGQDGLADGTPVTVLGDTAPSNARASESNSSSTMPPEAMAAIRQRMKDRGMSDEEVEERLQRMRQGGGQQPGRGAGGGRHQAGGGAGGIPPFMEQRIKDASPEELEGIKDRMRQFGMSDEKIDETIKKIRDDNGKSN
jgi:antitoxin component HigA of HigAB toxin-antitoxin module